MLKAAENWLFLVRFEPLNSKFDVEHAKKYLLATIELEPRTSGMQKKGTTTAPHRLCIRQGVLNNIIIFMIAT